MILPWKRNELSFFLFFVLNFFSFLIYKFLFQNENNIENSGKETKKTTSNDHQACVGKRQMMKTDSKQTPARKK